MPVFCFLFIFLYGFLEPNWCLCGCKVNPLLSDSSRQPSANASNTSRSAEEETQCGYGDPSRVYDLLLDVFIRQLARKRIRVLILDMALGRIVEKPLQFLRWYPKWTIVAKLLDHSLSRCLLLCACPNWVTRINTGWWLATGRQTHG